LAGLFLDLLTVFSAYVIFSSGGAAGEPILIRKIPKKLHAVAMGTLVPLPGRIVTRNTPKKRKNNYP
jgi:hypothetical protein